AIAVSEPLPELQCLTLQVAIGQDLQSAFKLINLRGQSAHTLEFSIVLTAKYFLKYASYHL
ncbi:MAG: hypothetical protein ACI9Z9_002865, partial [Litorivivens sp.]